MPTPSDQGTVPGRAREIMAKGLVWDNHSYIPDTPGSPLITQISRHHDAGFDVVLMNVADSDRDVGAAVKMLAYYRRFVAANPDKYCLLENVDDALRAKVNNKLAVGFNIEGAHSLAGRLDVVPLYYDLGVRWMSFVYNRANEFGGGVHDPNDEGLTPAGRDLVLEMERVGMIKCLSHTGYRTALDGARRTSRIRRLRRRGSPRTRWTRSLSSAPMTPLGRGAFLRRTHRKSHA